MTKTKKIVLGIFTFLPLVFAMLYVVVIALMIFGMQNQNQPNETFLIANVALMFFIIFGALACSLGMMIYYIIHITKNPEFDSNKQLIWIIILFFAHGIGSMVYWYLFIWKEKPALEQR